MPNEIWVGVVFLVMLSAVLGLTPFGRLVRGIGAQERAVIASGINVDRTKIAAYTLSGTMAGVAGVVMAARLGQARRRWPMNFFCRRSPASWSAARPSPAASAPSGAPSSAR